MKVIKILDIYYWQTKNNVGEYVTHEWYQKP